MIKMDEKILTNQFEEDNYIQKIYVDYFNEYDKILTKLLPLTLKKS